MKKHVISVLVANHSGVLSRVAGLFSRRGFNIDSLTVGETSDPEISRMTIVVTADDLILDQIKKQLNKLIDVKKVIELKPDASVYREIALVKVNANNKNRASIIEIVDIFRAQIIDVCKGSLVIEITGAPSKVEAFIELAQEFEIVELVRTGLTALQRGEKGLQSYKKFEEVV